MQTYLSTSETARALGISVEAVRKAMREGRMRPDAIIGASHGFKAGTVDRIKKERARGHHNRAP